MAAEASESDSVVPVLTGAAARRRAAQRALLTLTAFGEAASERIRLAMDGSLSANAPVAVLLHLDLHGPTRPTELRTLLGFSSGGVSRLLERLEDEGLVIRSLGAVAGDRRAVVVRLTPAGTRAARAVSDAAASVLLEQPDLAAALQELIDSLGSEHDRKSPPSQSSAS
jgi:DNA-binding MarR family transcriptional regulator